MPSIGKNVKYSVLLIAFSVKIMPGLFKKCLVIVAPAHGLAWSLHMRHIQCFLLTIQSCFRTQSTVLGIMYNSTSLWRVDPAFHSVLPQCFFFFFLWTLIHYFYVPAWLKWLFFFSFFSFFTFHCCQIRAYCLFFPLYFSSENECSLWRTCFRDAHPNLSIFCIHASILHKIFHNPF